MRNDLQVSYKGRVEALLENIHKLRNKEFIVKHSKYRETLDKRRKKR